MNVTTLDVETSYHRKYDDTVSSPFEGDILVSVGYKVNDKPCEYLCFNHNHQKPTKDAKQILQKVLDETGLLVGHNLKFDYNWLVSCGFTYKERMYDTMIIEYTFAKGLKRGFSLADSCKRRGLDLKATDLIDPYLKKKISYEDIPWEVVEEYGKQDVEITYQLACAQLNKINLKFEEVCKGFSPQ